MLSNSPLPKIGSSFVDLSRCRARALNTPLMRLFSLFIVFVALLGCSNEDGEDAFVAAVEINRLGVQSIEIQVGPQGAVLEAGTQSQFVALGNLEDSSQIDVSDRVTWTSGDASAFNVSQSGIVSAGSTDASAELGIAWGELKAAQTVRVSTAALTSLDFTGAPTTLSECLAGTTLSVEGTYADARTSDLTALVTGWTSTDTSVARVSDSGVLDALNAGNATIEATYQSETASLSLTVSDTLTAIALEPVSDFELQIGDTQAFTVTATETVTTRDATSIATYTVANTNLLTIDANGVASTGSTTGSTAVEASCGGLTSNSVTVTVVQQAEVSSLIIRYDGSSSSPAGPFEVNESPIQLQAFLRFTNGNEVEVTTSEFIEWEVSSVVSGSGASVSNQNSSIGEVRFTAEGRTAIRAVYDDSSGSVFEEDDIDVLVRND